MGRNFERCDLLLTPVMATRPPLAGAVQGLGTVRSLLRSLPVSGYAALWNVTGNPAASVPAGFGRDGLPLAVQLVGPARSESLLLSVAAQLQDGEPARPSL